MTVFRRVLVGYDGSDQARDALALGRMVGDAAGADLAAVCVYDEVVLEGREWTTAPELLEARREEMKSTLGHALDAVPDDVEAEGRLVTGFAEELADQPGIDLMVVGSRGYGPVRRVLLGSTSATLVRRAAVPVIVFPRGTAGPAGDAGRTVQAARANAST